MKPEKPSPIMQPTPIGRLPAYDNPTELKLSVGDIQTFHKHLVSAYQASLTATNEAELALLRAKNAQGRLYSALDWFESEVLAAQERAKASDAIDYVIHQDEDTEHA